MNDKKVLVIGALMLNAFASGLMRHMVGTAVVPLDFIFMVVGVFLLFLWFRLDSDEQGYRPSPLLNIGVIALALVAMPYYFFRTRGFAGGAMASAGFVVVGVVYTLLHIVGAYLAHFVSPS